MGKLEKIHPNAAGIDSEKIFVAVEGQEVKGFGTFTDFFKQAVEYLQQHHIESVAMEATGVYWIVLYDMLEEAGIDVFLVNPSDTRNVPGRKSDVQDCQWIQQLHSYGLLRKSLSRKEQFANYGCTSGCEKITLQWLRLMCSICRRHLP